MSSLPDLGTARGWFIIGGIIFLVLMTNACHEGGHALAAWWSGDRRASLRRRVTLNPVVHFHWLLTLVLPLISMYFLGWLLGGARPVMVDAGRIGPRRMALVALAGPTGNFLFAGFLVAMFGLALAEDWVDPINAVRTLPWKIIKPAIWFSVFLGVINLIPFPPLDGSRVIGMFLPERARRVWYALAPLGLVGLILLLLWIGGAAADWGWGPGHPELFRGLDRRLDAYIFEMKAFWVKVL